MTVAYRTIDGTAKKDDGDYSLTDGTLTIAARSRIGRIRATIRDDDVDENSETFKIQLSNPSNAAFAGDNSTIESTVTITDNDTRGVRVGPTTLTISEGWAKGYSVALGSEPTGTVTVTPSVSGSSDVTVSGALTFTTGNWYRAQQVTVTAGYDADTVDDSATISHTVTGGDYGSVAAASVSVTAEDYLNDLNCAGTWRDQCGGRVRWGTDCHGDGDAERNSAGLGHGRAGVGGYVRRLRNRGYRLRNRGGPDADD